MKVNIIEDKDGYFLIRIRNDKEDVLLKLHRLILEYKLKRKLRKNEVSHHKNGIKQDNRLENLEVKIKSNHQRQHRIERNKANKGKTYEELYGEKKAKEMKMKRKKYMKIIKRNEKGKFI